MLEKITAICRNFLWGGTEDYSHYRKACLGRSNKERFAVGEMGPWPLHKKQDLICAIKAIFKAGCLAPNVWTFQGKNYYKVSIGYHWLVGGTKVSWDRVIWARASIPHHAFIAWVFIHRRLPTKMRLNKFFQQNDLHCLLCNHHTEDDSHLFAVCPYAQEVWDSIIHWWPLPLRSPCLSLDDMTTPLSSFKAPKAHKQITFVVFAATIYFIWYARNQLLFRNHRITALTTVCMIKDQIRHHMLFLNTLSCKYSTHVDALLQ
ncbi:hypothetical protein Cgig2_025299 [Carnegiea gigantea]|uniref:Reverse transcriptase zinc-binding domain-containing protein n=1 Tax=Carnegiea gigantea TaxID=171969 RepID=A0A9Q1GMD4_9CARY|nr:hypothetical protein Cgig2_025299 [Carnegiea gigantea]